MTILPTSSIEDHSHQRIISYIEQVTNAFKLMSGQQRKVSEKHRRRTGLTNSKKVTGNNIWSRLVRGFTSMREALMKNLR